MIRKLYNLILFKGLSKAKYLCIFLKLIYKINNIDICKRCLYICMHIITNIIL